MRYQAESEKQHAQSVHEDSSGAVMSHVSASVEFQKRSNMTIGCVGMTHLGLIHATAFAERGFNLICYDQQSTLIAQLQRLEFSINEPNLDFMAKKNQKNMTFTDDIHQLRSCQVVFIAYDVPTDDAGNSELNVIHSLLEKVQSVLSPQASLVLLSQVPPGFTRSINLCKTRLFYQVETLIFGRAVDRALFPERYIIGAAEPANPLPPAYQKLLECFNCPILKMKYESAELAKISINMFLISSVATTNTLAEICEKIGADWGDIVPALRLDKRIGPDAYLMPGLGLAGGNLERDLTTIINLGQAHQTETSVPQSWLINSRYRRDWVLRCLQNHPLGHLKAPKICVLGLAYKPDTHSIKNSPAIALIQQLKGYQIFTHDPVVKQGALTDATHCLDLSVAIEGADIVIMMLSSDVYRAMTIEHVAQLMRGNIIIDPFGVLMVNEKIEDIHYYTLGKSAIYLKEKEVDYV